MFKIIAVWSGWAGAPGFSNFYFSGQGGNDQLAEAADRVHDFFTAITLCLPTPVSINVQPTSQQIASASGEILDEVAYGTPPPTVAGAGGPKFSAVSGACVVWRTGGTVDGRRVRGKTFLVPLAAESYQDDGTILESRLQDIRSAAAGLISGNVGQDVGELVVWSRPSGGAGGSEHAVVAATVSDRAAILRSRRA